jgi:hypothetical protein
LAGAGIGRRARGTAAQRPAISSGGGIAGGGLIEGPDASVHFSLFATRLPLGEDEALIISGRVQLADSSSGMRMESVAVDEYGPIEGDEENARLLRGTMRVTMGDAGTGDADAEYGFVLRAFDGGGPGEGKDTLTLAVGLAAGTPEAGASGDDAFSYELDGTVSAGDIELVDIALEAE